MTSKALEVSPVGRVRSWLQYFSTHGMAIMTFYTCFWCVGYRLSRKTLIDSKMGSKWDNLKISISQHVNTCLSVCTYIFDLSCVHYALSHVYSFPFIKLFMIFLNQMCLSIRRRKGYLSWLIFSAIPELEQVLEGSFDSISFQ